MNSMHTSPIIVALDYEQPHLAMEAAQRLNPQHCQVKIGIGLYTRAGPGIVEQLMKLGFKVFLDLKFHDIPNTVAMACQAAADLGVWMLNVHCLGGERMLEQACAAVQTHKNPPILLGVTVLTSMDGADLNQIGIAIDPAPMVVRLAKLAQQAGLDGVVCSAQEARLLHEQCGNEYILVTPGIRLEKTADDQRRVTTPAQAIENGAHYLVIGRPILRADNPDRVLQQIYQEVAHAQAKR